MTEERYRFLDLAAALLAYPSLDRIDYAGLEQATGNTHSQIRAIVSNMRQGVRPVEELLRAGYTRDQLPAWVGQRETDASVGSDESVGSVGSVAEQPTPIETPAPRDITPGQLTNQPNQGNQGNQPNQGNQGNQARQPVVFVQPRQPPQQTRDQRVQMHVVPAAEPTPLPNIAQAMDDYREEIGADGYTYFNNQLVRIITGPDGRPTVQPVTAAEMPRSSYDLDPEISQHAVESLKINTTSIIKKVAMSPTLMLVYGYVTTAKDPGTDEVLFSGDIGDWINYCCSWTAENLFGIRVGLSVGNPSVYTKMTPGIRGGAMPV